MFTAELYGLQNLLAEKQGAHDVYNVVSAGSATAATFGLIMPESLKWRARNMVLGLVLGATLYFSLVWLHLKLVEKANEGNTTTKDSREMRDAKSGLRAAIDRLEENLNK
ncbi:hypothetical protein like AT5G63000 [Hibiscus trionum]|uniref:Complex I assembly factor TIMMDC1, mitochondrial n=1 Tax=Hibiscus trionum TaxID=183268 RepID=A0A9W7H660_HIBTR|nr:hypothetical protein like AT5G63000 [Hibiscus trionum]